MFVQNTIKKRFLIVLKSPSGAKVSRVVEAHSEASAYLALPMDLRGPEWTIEKIEAK